MSKNGFTLIELMVTLVLVIVVTTLATYTSADFLKRNEQQVIMDELRTAIQYAKLQAIHLGQPVYLTALDAHMNWALGAKLSIHNYKTKTTEDIFQWQWNHPNWFIEWRGANRTNTIVFSSNTTQAISNGHFTITNRYKQDRIKIILNKLGRVRVVI